MTSECQIALRAKLDELDQYAKSQRDSSANAALRAGAVGILQATSELRAVVDRLSQSLPTDDWKRECEATNEVLSQAGAFEIVKGISWEGPLPASVLVRERDVARERVRVLETALAQAGIAIPDYEEPRELIGRRIVERLKAATRP